MPPRSKDNRPKCCGCATPITTSFNANLHPLLGILICKACYNSYGTGDFSQFEDGVDEHGDDNYCRLCVDGGDLFFCGNNDDQETRCHYGFCRDCIERNFPQDEVLRVRYNETEWKWTCLACDRSKLRAKRREAQEVLIKIGSKDLKRGVGGDETAGSATKRRKVDLEVGNKSFSGEPRPSRSDEDQRGDLDTSVKEKLKSIRADETPKTATDDPRGSQKDKSKQSSKDTPVGKQKQSDQDHVSRRPERVSSTEKFRVKQDIIWEREPEAALMPPLEKPKPPKTSLRNLGGLKSSGYKDPTLSTPPLKTPGTASTPQAKAQPTASPSQPAKPSPSIPAKPASVTPAKTTSAVLVSPTKNKSVTSAPLAGPSPTVSARPFPSLVPSNSVQIKPTSSTHTTSQSVTTTVSTTKNLPVTSSTSVPSSKSDSQRPALAQQPQIQTTVSTLLKSKPASKQLKVNSEPVVPKIVLSEMERKKRLEHFGSVKDDRIKEINSQFTIILEMFESLDSENKSLLKAGIEDIRRPIQDLNNMVANLEGLLQSHL